MPPTITWDLERWKSRPIGPVTASDLLNTVGCAIYPLTEPGSPLFSDERMHHDAVVKTLLFVIGWENVVGSFLRRISLKR